MYLYTKKKQKIFIIFSPTFSEGRNKSKTHIENYIDFSITILFGIDIYR